LVSVRFLVSETAGSANSAAKWNLGVCNYATHVEKEAPVVGKIKVNPLKAAKRAAAGR